MKEPSFMVNKRVVCTLLDAFLFYFIFLCNLFFFEKTVTKNSPHQLFFRSSEFAQTNYFQLIYAEFSFQFTCGLFCLLRFNSF